MTRRCSVIKAGAPVPAGGSGVASPFEVSDMLVEATRTRNAVRQEAQRLVREARAESAAIRKAAHDEGYRAGVEQGTRDGREAGHAEALDAAKQSFAAQQADLIAACTAIISEIDAGRAAWRAAARQDLVDLAMAIARRVARFVGDHERDVVVRNLEEVIELIGARSQVTITVNPKDIDSARVFARSLAETGVKCEHIRVVEEPEVSPGGCRVDWGSGAVDATLETQLDRIEAELSGGRS